MPPKGRLASFLRPCGLIWFSICLHWEAFIGAVRRDGLGALVRVQEIHDTALAKLFSITSGDFIDFEDTTVIPSLVQAASGVVLEIGPGAGNQIHRYNNSLVKYVYGVELNAHFKDDINAKLKKHSLQDRYKFIVSSFEDSDVLREEGIMEGSLDTVLCIQVLCAVKDPKIVMKEVWKLLKPGGNFIFWEHGWSKDHFTTAAQDRLCYRCFDRWANRKKVVLNPAWSTFVGCQMTRNLLADILNSGEWENPDDIEEPEDPFSCLPRIQGVLVKKA